MSLSSTSADPRTAPPLAWLRVPVSAAGLVLGALFFTAALTPSLAPRDPISQGVLCGVLAAIGHELGAAVAWIWRYLGIPQPAERRRRAAILIGAALACAVCAWGLVMAPHWADAPRRVMGMAAVETGHAATIGGVAALACAVLFALARLFVFAARRAARALDRVLPPRVGGALAIVITGYIFWAAIDGVLLQRALEAADTSLEAADSFIDPEIPPPEDPGQTGSAASLVDWNDLGRWGRAFVHHAPTREEIATFAGPEALDPVRVYVGRRAADTAEARARLALDELIRQGGFERAALLVTVPVGSGWVDPAAHDTLEFMLGGDVASVAVQYSYLTSVLSLYVAPEYGLDQARALFHTVYDHWRALPRDDRPALYVHGLSQGALNSQNTLPLLDILAEPIDGGLWAGSPFLSEFWSDVRDMRNPGSPAWRPRYGNGSLVRVTNQSPVGLSEFDAPWGPMRFVFLNYGSDAIVNFTFDSAFRRPAWMSEPRAPDVAPEFRWFPVVTMFQLGLDMAISQQVPGYGHDYIARDYITAWAAVVDPPGWDAARAGGLKALFAEREVPY